MRTKIQINPQAYPLLDIFQFVAALLVVLVHCGKLSSDPRLHFVLKSLLCRIAVPFYFVCSGFFYRERANLQVDYPKKYYQRQIAQYLKWSILYLPFGLIFISQQNLSPLLYPIALLAGLVYSGIWYHLWYIPALLSGLWLVQKAVEKLNYKKAFLLFSLLFALGSTETYSSFIEQTVLGSLYHTYRTFFFTTRNGLLFSPLFILCGFVLSDYKEHPFFQMHEKKGLFFSVLLLILEGWILYPNQGDDKNFLFSLVPLSFFLVAGLTREQISNSDRTFPILRSLNKYVYFLHPLFLELSLFAAGKMGSAKFEGFPLFFATLFLTGICIVLIEKKSLKRRKTLVRAEVPTS